MLPLYHFSNSTKSCPMEACDSHVRNLPRHLASVHGWPKSKAKKAVTWYGLRKDYHYSNPAREAKKKLDTTSKKEVKIHLNYHKKRVCPVLGCNSVNLRMPAHLREVHKIEQHTPYYYSLLKQAKPKWISERQWIEDKVKGRSNFKLKNAESEGEVETVMMESDIEDNEDNELSSFDNIHVNDTSEMMERFVKYKVSVDGGNGNHNSALQSRQQLLNIMQVLSSNDVQILFNKHKIRDTFLLEFAQKEKEYKALTIKRYILSLTHFYDFILSEEIVLSDVSPEDILRMKVVVSRWSKSYNEQVDVQQRLREMDEQAVLITPEQIKRYESAGDVAQAINILKDAESSVWTSSLSRQEFTCVRDYLLTEIVVISCHRSGVSSNMTIEEVQSATLRDDKYVIKVKKHKTFRKHGPALLCVSKILYQYLQTYIDKIRSELQCDINNMFVSFNGKSLASGAISKQINSVWQRSGVYGDNLPPIKKNISANIFRKSGSTIIEDQNAAAAPYVSSLLAHSEYTSKRHYRLTEKEKFAVRGTRELEVCIKMLFYILKCARFVVIIYLL